MQNLEIEALKELEDHIPYEYCRSCDSPDGLYHEWIDEDSWQYRIKMLLEEKDKEIERLQSKNKKIQTILRTRARHDRKRKAKLRKLRLETTNQRLKLERLNNVINESAEKILKELEENHHLSYGVALAIRQKLLDYKELKGDECDV